MSCLKDRKTCCKSWASSVEVTFYTGASIALREDGQISKRNLGLTGTNVFKSKHDPAIN